MPLEPEQIRSWEENGYLVLPSFYAGAELEPVDEVVREVWARNDERVVVDDLVTNRRCLLPALSDEERKHRFKTNDLYLTEERVRNVALSERISPILKQLLGHTPVLCNSLNFDQGSAQDAHVDSLYMTPRTRRHLCAIWVALEDACPAAGPLFYYPGSHKIAPHVFSNGGYHALDNEMSAWKRHIDEGIADLGLKREVFHAKRGDVFVWSSDLVHGGAPIENSTKTRKSVVFHYFSESDCAAVAARMEPMNNGFWLVRPRQSVPEDGTPARAPAARPTNTTTELRQLKSRVDRLEKELATIRHDPLGVRKRGARLRRKLLALLGSGSSARTL